MDVLPSAATCVGVGTGADADATCVGLVTGAPDAAAAGGDGCLFVRDCI